MDYPIGTVIFEILGFRPKILTNRIYINKNPNYQHLNNLLIMQKILNRIEYDLQYNMLASAFIQNKNKIIHTRYTFYYKNN